MAQDDNSSDSKFKVRDRATLIREEDGYSLGAQTEIAYSAEGWFDGTVWTRFPPNLPAEYYTAIGEVCARWSWLERQLAVIAREVLGIGKSEGFSVMAGMSMRTISAVLLALAEGGYPKKHPDLSKRVGELGQKMNNIGDMRNQYAHAIWGYESESNSRLGIIRFKKPEEKVEPRWTDKPVSAIRDDAKTLADLQIRAQELTRDLKRASRGK